MKSVLALLFLLATVQAKSDGGSIIDMMKDSIKQVMGKEGTISYQW